MFTPPALEPPHTEPIVIIRQAEEKPKTANPVTYKVKRGDSLSKIARRHHTSVLRLFYKNKAIKHPDNIKVGLRLVIPAKDVKLKARKIPAIISNTFQRSNRLGQDSPQIDYGGYSSSGNTYTPGQCTFGVKMWRPDIPNGWGNASEWMGNAQRMGWPTGTEPRVGAVAWTWGHVGLVTSIQGDTVTFKDMNGRYVPWEVNYRTIPKYSYKYIY